MDFELGKGGNDSEIVGGNYRIISFIWNWVIREYDLKI